MHELGIVFHIASQVEKVAAENHVAKVHKVTVEIGEVSTVIPDYLLDVWNWKASKSEVLDGCELAIEVIPAITFCEDCEQTYGTVEHGKTCPYCGSEHTYLVQGNEHAIKEIEVYDEYADNPPTPDPEPDGMLIEE
jgi:hydrogenase nickel incorporation protein HypA/HybF